MVSQGLPIKSFVTIVDSMPNNTSTVTADQLTDLLMKYFYAKYTKDFLHINAEVMVEKLPALAAVFTRILESDKSAAGWHRAMNLIDGAFDYISKPSTHVPSRWSADSREATPDEIRVNVIDTWNKPSMTDLMEQWSLTNAHYETGYVSHASGDPLEVQCLKMHAELVTRITDFDTVLTDEYWRGLVAFSMVRDWQKIPADAPDFIAWAGAQKDLKAVAALSSERATIDPVSLDALLRLKEGTAPAISEGVI